MEATARRVRADRNRRRLPERGAASRWTRRIAGLLATLAFLGVGVASYEMIAPRHKAAANAALAPTPVPTPAAKHHKRHKAKHHGLTKAQKAARRSAVARVRQLGFTTVKSSDYDPRATLRVLVARPVGNASAGSYAFFFDRATYLGRDSLSPSASVKVAGQTEHSVILSYRTCCPAKRVPVRFKLVGGQLQPTKALPASYLRAVHR
jgi:hypothetical protein